jgi:hypothetical protein
MPANGGRSRDRFVCPASCLAKIMVTHRALGRDITSRRQGRRHLTVRHSVLALMLSD